jgi:hypothetical protein
MCQHGGLLNLEDEGITVIRKDSNSLPVNTANRLTLKMKVSQSFETSATLYQSTPRNIPEDLKAAVRNSDLPVTRRSSHEQNKNEGHVYFGCDSTTLSSSAAEDRSRCK